jgi:hypothetical protein
MTTYIYRPSDVREVWVDNSSLDLLRSLCRQVYQPFGNHITDKPKHPVGKKSLVKHPVGKNSLVKSKAKLLRRRM